MTGESCIKVEMEGNIYYAVIRFYDAKQYTHYQGKECAFTFTTFPKQN